MKYIIANWKANKNKKEVLLWAEKFFSLKPHRFEKCATIIVCPAYLHIPILAEIIKEKKIPNLKLGSQDISAFRDGAHTGEVTARMLKEYIDYSIIGHSERVKQYHETDEIIFEKCKQANSYSIEPIFCCADPKSYIPDTVKIIVYEPPEAISDGSGKGNTIPINLVVTAKKELSARIKRKFIYIYGGSINEENSSQYLLNEEVDGVLVGGASLNAERFYNIISCLSNKEPKKIHKNSTLKRKS